MFYVRLVVSGSFARDGGKASRAPSTSVIFLEINVESLTHSALTNIYMLRCPGFIMLCGNIIYVVKFKAFKVVNIQNEMHVFLFEIKNIPGLV